MDTYPVYIILSHSLLEIEIQHGDIGIVGITDHATKALGDIVFVALPDVGDTLEAG